MWQNFTCRNECLVSSQLLAVGSSVVVTVVTVCARKSVTCTQLQEDKLPGF